MKRILIFSLAYLPHVGGAEVAIKEITDRIPDIEFHILTLNFGGEAKDERIGNVFVHRVGNGASYLSKILFIPRAAFAARALHRLSRFDAWWAMMSYMLFPVVLLRFAGLRIPYLLTLQEGDPFSHMFSRWFILPFRSFLAVGFRNAAAVQAISTYLAGWAKRMGYADAVEIIPNGCDMKRFEDKRPVQERRSFWENKHVAGADTILITTSRLVRKNGIDVVIRALARLPKDIRFVIVGDGKERPSLTALARSCGVAERVYFFGQVANSEIARYLHMSDIFVRPSRTEGMGNSFIEAMATGVPVIGTQVGGIADFLFDAKRNPEKQTTGWAVDVDSPEQVAAAAENILADPGWMARVVETARAFVGTAYEWDGIARRMKILFDRMVENRQNPRMKAVIATPLYPPEIGGPATYVRELETGLPPRGIGVTVVKFSDIRRWYFPKLIRHYVYYRRVLRAARNADVVLALDPVSVGLPAMKAARRAGKPFVVKIVGDYAWEQGVQRFGITEDLDAFVMRAQVPFPVRMLRRIQTRAARSAARVIVPSEYLKDIVTQWGIPEGHISVIYNGIELPAHIPAYQKKNDEFLIVSAGRRVPWKGFEAIGRAARGHANWRVVIASGLSRDEALGWMKAADVFVLNSRYEGFPHALIEAMTLGTPVIATDAGGNRTIVAHGETGLLIPAGDDAALERALTEVARNPAAARARARAAQKRMDAFSLPRMLDETARFLASV